MSAYRFARYLWSDTYSYSLGILAVLPGTLPIGRSSVGTSVVPTDRAVNSPRLFHFHMRLSFPVTLRIGASERVHAEQMSCSEQPARRKPCTLRIVSSFHPVSTGHTGARRLIPRPDLELT
jgi:hypothetical protein